MFPGVALNGSGLRPYSASSGRAHKNNATYTGWLRPFTPLTSTSAGSTYGNGKSTPDWAQNNAITRRSTWNAAVPNNQYNWRDGYFCHSSYAAAADVWQGGSGKVLGTEATGFYIQFRVKFSAGRFNSVNQLYRGKLLFVGTTADTPFHEIVIRSQAKPMNYNSLNDGGAQLVDPGCAMFVLALKALAGE